jgi:2-C-methyl-D-erythritol 4-phosphate cytidylyltransferase/2-C-methyl-D-erythritol 2,4-cyclodiphosphate synthase
MKLTTREDFTLAERLLGGTGPLLEPRNGSGFDVHAFAPGDHVWLCGVSIPHTQRLEGHSDADVALHALTDAILGAIGDGDIGEHFPPSNAAWRGAPSRIFLEDALHRVQALGGRIANVDVTILCEAPKIAPHREAMRRSIALMLQIDLNRVGVKATTMEGLGFVGRREGIAALANALVLLPA